MCIHSIHLPDEKEHNHQYGLGKECAHHRLGVPAIYISHLFNGLAVCRPDHVDLHRDSEGKFSKEAVAIAIAIAIGIIGMRLQRPEDEIRTLQAQVRATNDPLFV